MVNKVLSLKEATTRLNKIRPNIEIVGPYENQFTETKLRCSVHKLRWTAKPSDYFNSRPKNCVICATKVYPLTTRIHKLRLKHNNPNFMCLEEVVDAGTPIKHQCVNCDTVTSWAPSHAFSRATCAICTGTKHKYIGEKFGKLTVIKLHTKRNSQNEQQWVCECECGNKHVTASRNLVSGDTISCGCSKGVKHGMYDTDEYRILKGMIDRCHRKESLHYHRYGGRGIRVCKRWRLGENGLTGIECFVEDMGKRPSKIHSIDRENNDGNYTPNNCRWVTKKEQDRNKRNTIWVDYKRKELSLMDAIELSKTKLSYNHIYYQIVEKGMAFEDII